MAPTYNENTGSRCDCLKNLKVMKKMYYNPFIEGANSMTETQLIEAVKDSLRQDYPELKDSEMLSDIATIMVVNDDNVVVIDDDIMTEREARELGLI